MRRTCVAARVWLRGVGCGRNILVSPVVVASLRPYGFVGAGWTRFYVDASGGRNPLALADSDDAFALPVGAGVTAPLGHRLAVDTRLTYRSMWHDDLLVADDKGVPTPTRSPASLSQWTATGRLGV